MDGQRKKGYRPRVLSRVSFMGLGCIAARKIDVSPHFCSERLRQDNGRGVKRTLKAGEVLLYWS